MVTPKTTPAVGQYLIRIYTLLREGRRVVWARLAERTGVSPSAVVQAMRRMSRDGLVVLDPESGVQLTREGRGLAESIIRRHYLIERLLVDELSFNWADADDEAERLEHSLSPRLEQYLYERLGRPTTCPHGNPFPGSPNEERLISARRLIEATAGECVTVLRVTEEGEDDLELLHFFHAHHLLPGTEVCIEAVDAELVSLATRPGGQTIAVQARWAQHVCVSGPSPR